MKQAIILAAGKGTRIAPLFPDIPKPMIRIAGKPALEHTVEHMAKSGIEHIVMTIGHLGHVIRDYFGNGEKWGVEIEYSEERELLGTAGGAKEAAGMLDESTEPVLIWHGDNLCHLNLSKMLRRHNESTFMATIAVCQRADPYRSGIVQFDHYRKVIAFHEKPGLHYWKEHIKSNWISAGIYIMDPMPLFGVPDVSDFGKDVFPKWIKTGMLNVYQFPKAESLLWYDTPEDYHMLVAERGV